MKGSIKVTHYQRRSVPGAFSVERLFSDIRTAMPPDIHVKVHTSRFISQGLWGRIWNILEAVFFQGEINHVTGDVHFLTFLLRRRRTVLTVLDCVSIERLARFERWMLKLIWYVLPIHCSRVVTVISSSTKRELLKVVKFDPNEIHVIHCCVSACFTPNLRPFNTTRPRVLQIGTGPYNKNVSRVAAALDGIPCRWVIVGRLSAEQVADIESHNIEYENHLDLGDEALLATYQQADMLVFASTYEGFGLPILEANAVGRPVVTSTLYSMPEVAGDAACFVDPYDVACIRAGIQRIINDANYRDRLVQAGYRNIERFRPSVIAEQYSNLYRRIYRENT